MGRAGHDIKAFDIDPTRADAPAADGVTPAATVADAAAEVDALVLMVATPEHVESVLYGDGNAAASIKPVGTVVIMATVAAAPVQDWARRLATQNVDVVDAPVSGGVARAGASELLIMVSGPETAVRRVRPLLDAMARTAPFVGPEPGDAQKVKLVNQLLWRSVSARGRCPVLFAAVEEREADVTLLDARVEQLVVEQLRDGRLQVHLRALSLD